MIKLICNLLCRLLPLEHKETADGWRSKADELWKECWRYYLKYEHKE